MAIVVSGNVHLIDSTANAGVVRAGIAMENEHI